MARHNDTGKAGEQIAKTFLESKGYRILEANWRYRKAEIDLIAKDGETLIFTEVKTRSTDLFGKPEEAITPRKERLLADAASAYMEQIGHDWTIRFDVISIIYYNEQHYQIEHFQDAFFPGLE
ncbi:MAG: YraN family protein [Saprospiraceae bacterium]|nr:YraN family protein [Saprospiraceae bacterium]